MEISILFKLFGAFISIMTLILLLLFVFKPILMLIKYKFQGVPVIKYYPVTGIWGIFKRDFEKYGDSFRIFKQMSKEHPDASSFAVNLGRFYGSDISTNVTLFLIEPDMIKEFYQLNFYEKSPFISQMLSRMLGNGFVLDEKSHNRKRNIFSKLFHFDHLKQTIPKIQSITDYWLEKKFGKTSGSISSVDIIDFAQHITGDLITRYFFGIDMNQMSYKGMSIPYNLNKLNHATSNQMRSLRYVLTGTYTFDKGFFTKDREINEDIKNIKQILLNSLNQRLNQYEQKSNDSQKSGDQDSDGGNVIEELIRNNYILNKHFSEMSEKEIEDLEKSNKILSEEVLHEYQSFYLAGMETTGHTIGFALYYYCKYPIIGDKLRKEISEHIQSNQPITYEDISKLNYLDCFIKEVLRHYGPTSALFNRRVTKDHKIKNIEIKKGSLINVAIMSNFYNPNIFENPDQFRPERWLEQPQLNCFTYLPFSAGRRNCIGQHLALLEIKVFISHLLRDFKVSLTDPSYQMDTLQQFVHGPSRPIYLNFERIVYVS